MLTGLLFILIALFVDLPLWLAVILCVGGGIKIALSLFKYTIKFVNELHERREKEEAEAVALAMERLKRSKKN